jgi:BASS family bile acid:Na+ symporter
MNQVLAHALNVLILLFMVSALLEAGLGLTPRQILQALRSIRLVVSAMATSYVLVPLVAIIVSRIFQLEEHLKVGLILFSMSAGTEAAPLVVGFAKGNVGLAVGLLALQLAVSIFYVPLLLTQFLPEVQIDRISLLLKLITAVASPICLGLFLKARYERSSDQWRPYLHKTALIFMLMVFALILILNYRRILELLGSGAIGAALILVAAALLVGYLFGGPEKTDRRTLMVMTGLRNGTMALMIGSQAFDGQDELIMIVAAAIVMLFLVVPVSLHFGRSVIPGKD